MRSASTRSGTADSSVGRTDVANHPDIRDSELLEQRRRRGTFPVRALGGGDGQDLVGEPTEELAQRADRRGLDLADA